MPREYILRPEGTRYEVENLQEIPDKVGVALYVGASISWWYKGKL